MQRAAAGLAAACAGLLGRAYGARVVLLVGSGDNGGDALYAGARLARRGAGVTRRAAGARACRTRAGWPRCARPGGRVRGAGRRGEGDRRAGGAVIARAGPRGGRHRGHRRQGRTAARGRGVGGRRCGSGRSSPSTCRAASTPTRGEVHGRGRTGRRDGHLRRVQAGAADRPGARVRGCAAADRHRPRPAPAGADRRRRRSSTPTWPRCCRVPARRATSTGAAWSASSPARRATRAPPCWPSPARCAAVRAPCGTWVPAPER